MQFPDSFSSRWRHLCFCLLLALQACGGGADSSEPSSQAVSAAAGRDTTASAAPQGQVLPEPKQAHLTGNLLDFAINGPGWLLTYDERNHQQVATRYGHLFVSPSGLLVDEYGRPLMGRPAAAPYGTPASAISALPMVQPPKATSRIKFVLNLNANTYVLPWDAPLDVGDASSYNCATVMTMYDAAGRSLALALYFRRVAGDTWSVWLSVNGTPLSTTQPSLQLSFWPNGTLRSSGRLQVDIPALPMSASKVDTSSPLAGLELDLSGATQFSLAFGVTEAAQDGHAAGNLTALNILPNGLVQVLYSNGTSVDFFRLLLARYLPTDRFFPVGAHGWACATTCTEPFVEEPGSFLFGELVVGFLEN